MIRKYAISYIHGLGRSGFVRMDKAMEKAPTDRCHDRVSSLSIALLYNISFFPKPEAEQNSLFP
jgi:hypothetical protein